MIKLLLSLCVKFASINEGVVRLFANSESLLHFSPPSPQLPFIRPLVLDFRAGIQRREPPATYGAGMIANAWPPRHHDDLVPCR